MIVEYGYVKSYLIGSLEASPIVFSYLLEGLSEEEADRHPDPDRFTIREVLAHLADWELIFQDRLQRTRNEDEPALPWIDEGALAVERDYAHKEVQEQLRLFSERRAATVALLNSLSEGEWQRVAKRENVGRMTMEGLAVLIPLHDAYHQRQIVEWRRR
jgi:hypothetical protein